MSTWIFSSVLTSCFYLFQIEQVQISTSLVSIIYLASHLLPVISADYRLRLIKEARSSGLSVFEMFSFHTTEDLNDLLISAEDEDPGGHGGLLN